MRTMFFHGDRLMTVVAEGDLFPAQIAEVVQLIDRHNARSYGKLIDLRRMRSCVRPDGESTLATLATQRAQAAAVGAIALIIGNDGPYEAAACEIVGVGSEERPIRLFRDEAAGWAWLQGLCLADQ